MIEQAERKAEQAEPAGLHIRCPQCHNPVELVDDASLSDVLCPTCGSQFSLVNDSNQTFQALSNRRSAIFNCWTRSAWARSAVSGVLATRELDRQVAVKIPRKGQLTVEDGELVHSRSSRRRPIETPSYCQRAGSWSSRGPHLHRLAISCKVWTWPIG